MGWSDANRNPTNRGLKVLAGLIARSYLHRLRIQHVPDDKSDEACEINSEDGDSSEELSR